MSRSHGSPGRGANNHNLRFTDWLFRSRAASVIWLAVRLVLGYWWINAGYQKIWGSEKAGFWFGGGAGVKGFATAGVLGSATGKGGASYGWWAAFLHNFVIPNASWIAKLIALGELAIGIGLVIGLFTGLAALGGLLLNVIYMFTGSAGVNPAYAILEVPLDLGLAQRRVSGSGPLRTRYRLVAAPLQPAFRSRRPSTGSSDASRPQPRPREGLRRRLTDSRWAAPEMSTRAQLRRGNHAMKALVYHGPNEKSWDEVPDPELIDPTDAIVAVEATTICGSDLHILKGDLPEVTPGRILGHEAVGTVEAVGPAVRNFKVGDRVLVSCISACGRCRFCRESRFGQCLDGGGWILGHNIDGTQAEKVRVPFARHLGLHGAPRGQRRGIPDAGRHLAHGL